MTAIGLTLGTIGSTPSASPAATPAGGDGAPATAPYAFPNHEDLGAWVPTPDQPPLYEAGFSDTAYGRQPDGWLDLVAQRPSPNWAVDGKGFLRPVLKSYTGLIAYDGALAGGQAASELSDVVISAAFKKTEDADVFFGLAGRVQDRGNYYAARFAGDTSLELYKVAEGKPALLGSFPTSDRYREGEVWRLALAFRGPLMSAVVFNAKGEETGRVDGRDEEFAAGRVGIHASTFGAASSVKIEALHPYAGALSAEEVARRNASARAGEPRYPILKPADDVERLNTPFEQVREQYDVVVAGAGTGGFAAAVQAARMGCRVLLLEETDWIGGQMCAAAVASMDDAGCYGQFPVRERGIYREFHEGMVNYYYTLGKDPYNAYYSGPTLEQQVEGGYEPKVARAMLYALIADARNGGRQGRGVLDLSVRTKVASVRTQDNAVRGVTVEAMDQSGTRRKDVACRILIDATEYGDVLPLAGVAYRVGNVTSASLNPEAPLQDHTWTAVIREYPGGVPEHLKLTSPPPDYETYSKKWRHYHRWGSYALTKPQRLWEVYFTWRGMADSDGPLTGRRSERRHTQCGFNGGNDYPVTVAAVESIDERHKVERDGIHRTLAGVYYFQNELGLNWSLAQDEGYDTPYNRWKMKQLRLRSDIESIAVHLPQMPYVREARRMIGVRTLVADDLSRYDREKLHPTSVAMGDYFMDLHRTEETIEHDLDSAEYDKTDGPFQVPFDVFLPEKLDGFLAAEKNISQSRLANGATRLQPVTMLTGQAAGTIAALAVKQQIPPRELDVKQVQQAQLESGSTLVQRWYSDVPWGTPLWRATQLLSLYQVMDRVGPINKDRAPLGSRCKWGADLPLRGRELGQALDRLAQLKGGSTSHVEPTPVVTADQLAAALGKANPAWAKALAPGDVADPAKVKAGEFAVVAARILLQPAEPARRAAAGER